MKCIITANYAKEQKYSSEYKEFLSVQLQINHPAM